MTTLLDILAGRAAGRERAEPALHIAAGGGWMTWTWADTWSHVQRAAAGLSAAGIRRGDHLVVLAVDSEQSVRAILGAWALGAVVTPVGVPLRADDIAACVRHVEDSAAIVDAMAIVAPRAAAALAGGITRRVLIAEDLDGDPAGERAPDGAELALVQLTSGTTGRARGVMVSHDRLACHLAAMQRALPLAEGAVGLSWLPLFHDMGLIGGLLFPLFCGFELRLSSPLAFRQNPFGWLENLSRFRVTITPAPPSVWGLCRTLAPRAVERGLDLSGLDCALVGAEPISAAVLEELATALAPCGFAPEAFFPVYGLAEATLAVSFPRLRAARTFDAVSLDALGRGRAEPARDREPAATFVGVGRPLEGTALRIAGEGGAPLPERQIGHIEIASRHAMLGYRGEPPPPAWISTGDLGYLADGELFVTGRAREIIIRAGVNLVPGHIEEVASRVDGVRAGCIAAVGVWSDRLATELAWVVAETRRPPDQHAALARAIRDALGAHGVPIDEVRLVPPGALPRTTSGKQVRARVPALVGAAA